jgi:hypothetical protein
MYSTEAEMSDKFEVFIKKEFGDSYIKEFRGLFGRPDFLFYYSEEGEQKVICFELKLKNWKIAMIQAFRYKSFSNSAYVVMPKTDIKSKKFSLDEFKKYDIGLAEFDSESNFKIVHKPKSQRPYSQQLSNKLINSIGNDSKEVKSISHLTIE